MSCHAQAAGKVGPMDKPRRLSFSFAFGLYWLSSFVLQARNATDASSVPTRTSTPCLLDGIVVDGLARFHPVTTAMAMGWMKILGPLTAMGSAAPYIESNVCCGRSCRGFGGHVGLRREYAAPIRGAVQQHLRCFARCLVLFEH